MWKGRICSWTSKQVSLCFLHRKTQISHCYKLVKSFRTSQVSPGSSSQLPAEVPSNVGHLEGFFCFLQNAEKALPIGLKWQDDKNKVTELSWCKVNEVMCNDEHPCQWAGHELLLIYSSLLYRHWKKCLWSRDECPIRDCCQGKIPAYGPEFVRQHCRK